MQRFSKGFILLDECSGLFGLFINLAGIFKLGLSILIANRIDCKPEINNGRFELYSLSNRKHQSS